MGPGSRPWTGWLLEEGDRSGATQVLEQGARGGEVGGAGAAARHDPRVIAALQLGWRVAELYALVNDPGEVTNDTLLPGHASLEEKDQLQLQLRAAAGDARRAGVTSNEVKVDRLLAYAREAPRSDEGKEIFRSHVRRCHVELSKDLWSRDEAAGKAYELGNGLSDTYSRICKAYREPDEDPRATWLDVFHRDRIERLKTLLDDLQSRLNPGGVTVVSDQLEAWSERVRDRLEDDGELPSREDARVWLRRQTITWRQLLAGDKEPEAYLDTDARAELRGDMRDLALSRGWGWIVAVAGSLFLLVAFLPEVMGWYKESVVGTAAAAAVVAAAGVIGITRASIGIAVRARVH